MAPQSPGSGDDRRQPRTGRPEVPAVEERACAGRVMIPPEPGKGLFDRVGTTHLEGIDYTFPVRGECPVCLSQDLSIVRRRGAGYPSVGAPFPVRPITPVCGRSITQ